MNNDTFVDTTFEKFMEDIHYQIFPEVLDDDLPDHFDHWLSVLDVANMMEWAEIYGRQQFLSGQSHAFNVLTKQ